MDMIPLSASEREKTAKAGGIRRTGHIPCILYGHETENIPLQCKAVSLKKAYEKAGESTLVELNIGPKRIPVLFYDIHFDPVSDRIIHADFFAVNMKEEVETEVPIRFIGVAPAIAEHDAVLVTTTDHVTVKCLPANLPHDLPVSLESLCEVGDAIHVRDIALPENVRALDNPETVIALIQEKREEEVKEEVKPIEEIPAEGAQTVEEGAQETQVKEEAGDAEKNQKKRE